MRLIPGSTQSLVFKNSNRSPVCSECFVELRLHNRSETALSPLVHGRLRNLK